MTVVASTSPPRESGPFATSCGALVGSPATSSSCRTLRRALIRSASAEAGSHGVAAGSEVGERGTEGRGALGDRSTEALAGMTGEALDRAADADCGDDRS